MQGTCSLKKSESSLYQNELHRLRIHGFPTVLQIATSLQNNLIDLGTCNFDLMANLSDLPHPFFGGRVSV